MRGTGLGNAAFQCYKTPKVVIRSITFLLSVRKWWFRADLKNYLCTTRNKKKILEGPLGGQTGWPGFWEKDICWSRYQPTADGKECPRTRPPCLSWRPGPENETSFRYTYWHALHKLQSDKQTPTMEKIVPIENQTWHPLSSKCPPWQSCMVRLWPLRDYFIWGLTSAS